MKNERCYRVSNTAGLIEGCCEKRAFDQVSSRKRDLFVSSGARIVLSADIDVLDDLAVTFVSVVVKAKT